MPDGDTTQNAPVGKPVQVPVLTSPEEVMVIWRTRIEELPKLDVSAARQRLQEMQTIRIPAELMMPEGYIKLFGKLQALRGEALQIVALVNEHFKTRVAAVKSMQAIFPGMSTRKSVGEREAEAESWLIYVERGFTEMDVLNDLAKGTLDHVNRSVADAVQQLKSINQFSVPSGLLDSSRAVPIPHEWDVDQVSKEEEE